MFLLTLSESAPKSPLRPVGILVTDDTLWYVDTYRLWGLVTRCHPSPNTTHPTNAIPRNPIICALPLKVFPKPTLGPEEV